MKYLETHADEGTGPPLVLVDNHILVVENGIVHDKSDTSEEALREIINDSKPLIKNHVETDIFSRFILTVYNHLIAIIDHDSWQYRGVKQPFTAQHEVIAVATAETYMAELNRYMLSIGRSLPYHLIVGFDTTALIADTEQP